MNVGGPPSALRQVGHDPDPACANPACGGKVGVRFRCINQIGASGSPDPSQLFTKYYRSPEASCVSGAGVGLWLCKQFTEVMTGEIHCEVMDQTISFSLWIPDTLG